METHPESIIDVRLVLSIGVPALIVVFGWFLGHLLNSRRELNNKRREIRLRGLETAYSRLAMASNRDWTDQHRSDFEQFIAEIQLYGTPRQIELTVGIIKAFINQTPSVSFDPLLEELRNSLRQELRMEPVSGPVWWYRFKLPEWWAKVAPEAVSKSGAPTEGTEERGAGKVTS